MTSRLETKMWRPVGFPGLEIEKDVNLLGKLRQPRQLMLFSDLTVHTRGRAEGYAFFDKTYHRPGGNLDGMVFLQNAGDTWEVDADFTEPASTWSVRLLQGQEQRVFSSLGLDATSLHLDQRALTDRLRRRLACDIEQTARSFEAPVSALERETRLLELLTFALTHCAVLPLSELRLGREHRAVRVVKEILQTYPERDHTLVELAALTRLNQHYLYRVFQREVGLSPHSYQTSVRIHRVKDLLAAGVSIAQASLETGFVDQSHMTRIFKKLMKTTPGQFRRDSLGGAA